MGHTVKWVAPTHRTDPTVALGPIAHYTVYVDGKKAAQTGAAQTSIDLSAQPFFKTLTPGVHSVTITAVDSYGTESAQSSGATIVVPPPSAPNAPSAVTVS